MLKDRLKTRLDGFRRDVNPVVKPVGYFIKRYIYVIAAFLLVVFLLSYFGLSPLFKILEQGNVDKLVLFIKSFGLFAPVVLSLLIIFETIFAPLPGFVLSCAAGLLYGVYVGALILVAANMIGAVIAFYIGRFLGRDIVEQSLNKNQKQIFDKYSQKYGVYTIFILRLNPLTSSDILSYLAGVTNMNIWKFAAATGLGLLPTAVLGAWLGNSIVRTMPLFTGLFYALSIAYVLIFVYAIIKFRKAGIASLRNKFGKKKKE